MSTVLFLDSVAGIAGDMFAASFVDAGLVTREELAALPGLLGLPGVEIVVTRVIKATMQATHIDVLAPAGGSDRSHAHEHGPRGDRQSAADAPLVHSHPTQGHSHGHGHGHGHDHAHEPERGPGHDHGHGHTHYADVDELLARSRLAAPVKDRARQIFRLLAEAEAAAHGRPVAEVAFHEVGTIDSILDVVMAAYCVHKVGAARLGATPLKVGRGVVTMEHGVHPIPPPASARLLIGLPVAAMPDAIVRPNVELSTPTGIAILKALAPEFRDSLPPGTVRAQGMGGGTMDLGGYPNVFRIVLLEAAEGGAGALPYERDQVVEIACNIDDDTAERVAWLAERLMQKGALDVWTTPVTGKKGRAAVTISVLAEAGQWPGLADWLLRNSSTFGLRHRTWDRLKLVRRFEQRATASGPVAYKIGSTTTGEVLKEKAEFEDLRRGWDAD
jgi:hypothetical protein